MSETSMKWYVLRAVSGKEGKVKEFIDAAKKHNDVLEAHVGEVLLPTEKYAMLRNGNASSRKNCSCQDMFLCRPICRVR